MSKSDSIKSSKKRKLTSTTQEEAEVPEPTVEESAPALTTNTLKKEKKSKKSSKKDEDEGIAMEVEAEDKATEEVAAKGEGEAEEVEVPAMSHKALRLAKRRKLAGLDPLPLPSSTSTTTSTDPSTSTSTPSNPIAIGQTPTKSAHGIWVGNLSFKTTGKVLLDWFADRGLKEVTRMNIPGGKRTLEFNRGFAYIDFPTSTDVEIAVGLSEQHLDGRKLLIKSSTDYTGRPAPTLPSTSSLDPSSLTDGVTLNKTARKILDRQKNAAGPTLFVGNLGFETTVDDIRGMFDAHQRGVGGWDKKEKERLVKTEKKEKGKEGEEEEGSDEHEDEEEVAEEVAEDEAANDSDEDEEEGDDDEDDGEEKIKRKRSKEAKPKGPLDLSKAKDAGIRKVRLGTFEDSGKCKGWAFIDFHLPTQATRALLNVHNHNLNGRSLVLEYASAEAVRRGGLGTKAGGGGGGGGRGGRGAAARERGPGPRGEKNLKRGRDWDDGDVVESAKRAVAASGYGEGGEGGEDGGERKERGQSYAGRGGFAGAGAGAGPKRPQQGRAKPGAALASAQRASEAIVESRGKKITFD